MEKETTDSYLKKCPECGNNYIAFDDKRAEITCGNCGLVIEDNLIDTGPEWRAFSSDEINKKTRTGPLMPLFVLDKGTNIDSKNKDAHGKYIDSKMVSLINRLRKWNRRAKINKSKDRNLSNAMEELDRLASRLHLSENIKEDTALNYRKVVNKKLTKGRSIIAMLLACIYISCKQNDTPKTFDEISEASQVDKKKIVMCYKTIFKELKLENKITSPKSYVSGICSVLKLSGNTENIARNIVEKSENTLVSVGKHPKALAGAAIYAASLANNEKRTQKEISVAAGVSEGTIRNQFNEIKLKVKSFL